MIKEEKLIISVLSDYVNNRKTEFLDEIDWESLLLQAQKHQVEAVVYEQIRMITPAKYLEFANQYYAGTVFYYSNRKRLLNEIFSKYEDSGIEFFIVKGIEVADCYPNPVMRTMGDCDIVVKPDYKESAGKILEELGFKCLKKRNSEWVYSKNRIEVELHDHLLYPEPANSTELIDFFDTAWHFAYGEFKHKRLDWNYHFLFLLVHLRKHIINYGVGLRQFLDLAFVIKNQNLDWKWIAEQLQDLKLLEFTKVCFKLCEIWFDVHTPFSKEISEESYKRITERVISNGVFGFDNDNNKDNIIIMNPLNNEKKRLYFRTIFPCYTDMCVSEPYKWIRNRPYLVPFAWLYRFCRVVFNKKKIVNHLASIDKLNSCTDKVTEWETYKSDWNL